MPERSYDELDAVAGEHGFAAAYELKPGESQEDVGIEVLAQRFVRIEILCSDGNGAPWGPFQIFTLLDTETGRPVSRFAVGIMDRLRVENETPWPEVPWPFS